MNVELGAGERPAPGYLAVDVNPRNANVIADASHLPFRDQSIERLRAVDVLEHLSYRDTAGALAEWARVTTVGADLYVQVPDAATIMEWFAGADDRLLNVPPDLPRTHLTGATWRLLGGHADGTFVDRDGDWRWNCHYALFSRSSLEMALAEAGFTVGRIDRNGHPNLCVHATRC